MHQGDGRQPWVLLSVVVALPGDAERSAYFTEQTSLNEDAQATVTGSFTESYRKDICIKLNLDIFVTFGGSLDENPHVCHLDSFFEVLRGSGYNPVVLHRGNSLMRADVALLPTRQGVDMCVLKLEFVTLSRLSEKQVRLQLWLSVSFCYFVCVHTNTHIFRRPSIASPRRTRSLQGETSRCAAAGPTSSARCL